MNRQTAHSGLSLLDTIVTLAVLSAGAGLALPALSRSREGANSATCMRNLGFLGKAISLYVADNGGYLPGPTHQTVPWNAQRLYTGQPQLGVAWNTIQLPYYLVRYTGNGRSDIPPADVLACCPTADGIPVASRDGLPWYQQAKSFYVVNSIGGNFSREISGVKPYYTTKPRSYFGLINFGSMIPPPSPAESMPKQLDMVANAAREWAIADLWYWEAAAPRQTARQVGTWPYLLSSSSGAISNNGQLTVPSYPVHQTSQAFSPQGTDRQSNSPRLTSGRTNAVYFDAHVESVSNWEGTVNPCFDVNLDNVCD